MDVKVFSDNIVKANMYVLEYNDRAIIVDPSIFDSSLTDCKVEYILLTHEHFDHISAVNYWKERTGAKVICSKNCQIGLENPAKNFSRYFKEFCDLQNMIKVSCEVKNEEYRCFSDIVFENQFSFIWNSNEFFLFETPGHSKGSTCILVNNKLLFCGDTLFKDFPIATGLPAGSKKQWLNESKPKLESLPKELMVYPGHSQSFVLEKYKFWEMI